MTAATAPPVAASPAAPSVSAVFAVLAPSASSAAPSLSAPSASSAMSSYYRTMEQFLEMQQDVMQAFLARRVAPRREETAKPPAELPTAPGVVALATLSAVSA